MSIESLEPEPLPTREALYVLLGLLACAASAYTVLALIVEVVR